VIELTIEQVIAGRPYLASEGAAGLRMLMSIGTGSRTTSTIDENAIPFHVAFLLWFWNMLRAFSVLKRMEALSILQMNASLICNIGKQFEAALTAGTDMAAVELFLVADRRFVKFSRQTAYYDLRTGTLVESLPPTFEGISYNLIQLARKEYHRSMEGHENATEQPSKAAAVTADNVGNSVAGSSG